MRLVAGIVAAGLFTSSVLGQNPAQNSAIPVAPNPTEPVAGAPVRANSVRDQRKAAKLYLEGVKLLNKERPEEAWNLLKQAMALEPWDSTYGAAAELARQGAVTQLIQKAIAATNSVPTLGIGGVQANPEAVRLLQHALEIDPKSETVKQHLEQMGALIAEQKIGTTANAAMGEAAGVKFVEAAGAIVLQPDLTSNGGKHTFHLKTNAQQVVKEVFRAYGIEASLHESVGNKLVRMDVEDATFPSAMRVLSLLTGTFYEPLDPHRVLVAKDTREFRTQFQHQEMETVYMAGLTDTELTDMSNLARNVFGATQAVVEPTSDTLTLRASPKTLTAFNSTIAQMLNGRGQLDLNVKIIQLAHVASKETGTQFFQQTGVANTYSQIASIISQNQSLVQQVISAGLVPDASTLAHQIEIIAILLASGQLTGTIFNQGFALFGGGLTSSILSPGPATLQFNLNSSDTKTLDDIHLRLSDLEAGTFKTGTRYPIVTSSYSSVALPAAVAALTGASSSLNQTIPQIQYQDLGLTLKATPKIMRSDDVALTMELKIDALSGSSLNDIPILASRQISGVLTLKAGETAVLLSDLTRSESRALSGLPGVSDIPGFRDIGDVARNQNVARLLILVTPSVVRGTEQLAHGPKMPLDKGSAPH